MTNRTTPEQDKAFFDLFFSNIKPNTFLSQVLEILKEERNSSEFFKEIRKLFGDENDVSWILDWVSDNFSPEDVFDENILYNYALSKGWKQNDN